MVNAKEGVKFNVIVKPLEVNL